MLAKKSFSTLVASLREHDVGTATDNRNLTLIIPLLFVFSHIQQESCIN